MAINAQNVAQDLISYAIVTDKAGLVKLLERNGIQMPNNPSDYEVSIAVLTASAKSTTFKNELSRYLTDQANKAAKTELAFVGDSTDFGFTGIDDFSFTGADDFVNVRGNKKPKEPKPAKPATTDRRTARVSETNPKGKTGFGLFLQNVGASLFSQENINSAINLGLTTINTRVQNRQNAAQDQALIIQDRADQMKKEIADSTKAGKAGLSPISWVFIGVGVLALGGLVYFLVKKSNK